MNLIIIWSALFFIFGTIVGSFLNVIILRYGTGRSTVSGRSSCPNCRHELGAAELVPLFSFLFQGGRCRHCRSKISWQYPAVEFLTGLIFTATFLKYSIFPNPPLLIIDLIIFSLLIVILVYDLRHKIIPDGPVYAFILLSLFKVILHASFFIAGPFLWLNILSGPIMFLPFFLIWLISDGRWMGFGDAKLALGIGWFLGFIGGLNAIILGFWTGAIVGIFLLLAQSFQLKKGHKKLTIKSEIPFAPFLILGLILIYFFNLDVTNLASFIGH